MCQLHFRIWLITETTTLSSEDEKGRNSSFHRFPPFLFGAELDIYGLASGSLCGGTPYSHSSCPRILECPFIVSPSRDDRFSKNRNETNPCYVSTRWNETRTERNRVPRVEVRRKGNLFSNWSVQFVGSKDISTGIFFSIGMQAPVAFHRVVRLRIERILCEIYLDFLFSILPRSSFNETNENGDIVRREQWSKRRDGHRNDKEEINIL